MIFNLVSSLAKSNTYVSFLVSEMFLASGLGSDLVEGSSPSLMKAFLTIVSHNNISSSIFPESHQRALHIFDIVLSALLSPFF